MKLNRIKHFFKTSRAKKEEKHNCYIKDLSYATSAAPTYFPAAQLTDMSGRILHLVDGGVSVNNPALAAAVYALELYGRNVDLFVLSIGTGTNYSSEGKNIKYKDVNNSGVIGWMQNIIPMMMYASNQVINYEMYYVFNFHRPKYYFRFQPTLQTKHSEMDNISEKNIEALKQYAKDLVTNEKQKLDCIAAVLTNKEIITPCQNNIK